MGMVSAIPRYQAVEVTPDARLVRNPMQEVRIGLVRQTRSPPDRDQLTEPPASTTMRASLRPVDASLQQL